MLPTCIFAVYIGVIALVTAGTFTYANLFSGSTLGETFTDDSFSYSDYSQTPLMQAVIDADTETVNQLIEEGVNLEEQDS